MANKVVTICDVCLHSERETLGAQPLVVTVNRDAEQVIDLCDSCRETYVDPFLALIQSLGRRTFGTPSKATQRRQDKAVRSGPARPSRPVSRPAPIHTVHPAHPELVAAPASPTPDPEIVQEPAPQGVPTLTCKEPDCDFSSTHLKGFIAHATQKHHMDWDQIARAVGAEGGEYLCPVCGMGFPTVPRRTTHLSKRHPKQVR